MGISGRRISSSVRMRVIPGVSVIRFVAISAAISIAISVAAAEESRGNSVRSCGACAALADKYAGSASERDGRGPATSALQARRTLAPRAGRACDASSSVGEVGAVGARSDGVADGIADDVVIAVLVGGEDDNLGTLR